MRVPRALQRSSPRDMAYGYFFVCFIVNLSLVAGQSVHYALKGGEAILSTTISKPPDDILWKHNEDKVITFDSSVERVFREYEGRVTLAWDTAELTISDVRYEDSGKYELEALIQDKRHYFQIMLKVLDEVAKPTITCEINDESSNKTSGRRATLLCSSESQTPESLTFQWNVDGEVHMGQRLPIALGKEHNELKYLCTAENPLHNETAVFITKDCNTERKLENQTVGLPIIIIIVVLVLIVLCIFLFIFRNKLKMVRFKKGKKGGNMDLEQPECDEQNESQKLLLDRQETFASKQKLPQQLQSENGNVRDTPQKEGAVQKNKKIFDQGEQTELQASPSPQSRPPHVDQDSESGPSEAESEGQSDSEEKTHTDPMVDKELQTQHSEHEKDQNPDSGLGELESKDQRDVDGKSHTDKESQRDHSDCEKAEESALTGDLETSTNEKKAAKAEKSVLADDSESSQTKEPTDVESSKASGQPGEPNNTHNNVETEGQPDAQNKVHVENPDPDFETDEHKSKDQMVEQETRSKEEEEPLQNNSSPEKLNPDGELYYSLKEQLDQPEQQGLKNTL